MASGVPAVPNDGLVLGSVEDEGLLELVGHFGQLSHERVDQPQGTQGDLPDVADLDGVADLGGDEVEERPGGDRFGAGQVPDLADGSLVGAEGGQAGSDVGHVAVGVREVRVADEVGPLAGHGIAENPLSPGWTR